MSFFVETCERLIKSRKINRQSFTSVDSQVGWAFGIGLERIAMLYYGIEDIRAFWSEDPGFHAQFNFNDPYKRIKFKPISTHPPCFADLSFWVPNAFEPNDFYDLVSIASTTSIYGLFPESSNTTASILKAVSSPGTERRRGSRSRSRPSRCFQAPQNVTHFPLLSNYVSAHI